MRLQLDEHLFERRVRGVQGGHGQIRIARGGRRRHGPAQIALTEERESIGKKAAHGGILAGADLRTLLIVLSGKYHQQANDRNRPAGIVMIDMGRDLTQNGTEGRAQNMGGIGFHRRASRASTRIALWRVAQ